MHRLRYLAVEEAVDQRHEKTLERRQKVRRVTPYCELQWTTMQRRIDHDQCVGDAQQRQQDNGSFDSFSVKSQRLVKSNRFIYF